MKVLFDTNVILDLLLEREPHVSTAEQLLSLVDANRIEGLICSTTVTTIHYLASRAVGASAAAQHIRTLHTLFSIACIDLEVLRSALDLGFADFEDAVIHEAARNAGASALVTRNGKDFARSALPVFSPSELLAAVRAESA